MTSAVSHSRSVNVVTAREACFEDYSQIAALEARNGLPPKPPEEWKHLWTHNPALEAIGRNWAIGWVLQDQNGQIVGSFGNIPLLFELKGQPLVAASGRAWAVDPQYRTYAILLLDYFLNQKNVDLFLNTTANPEASSAFAAFHACRVPMGRWDESIFWITKYRDFAQSSLRAKSVPMASLASYPAAAVFFLLDKVLGHNRRRLSCAVAVAVCNCFDNRFDDFWRQLRSTTKGLLAVRTREVLNWHFRHALERQELLILAVGDRDRLDAYAIFARQDNERLGLRRMRLVDFQCIRGAASTTLLSVLTFAMQQCLQDGVYMLEVTGLRREYATAAAQLSPRRRKLSSWRYLYKANDPEVAELLKNPATWDPSCYDGDASL